MSYCSTLVQLGLINTTQLYEWNEDKFTALLVELVESLPNLIAFLVVVPESTKSKCIEATSTLESKFRPTRPCFCVQITNSLDSNDPPNLPFVHYKALALDQPPSVGGLPYHLIPRDQIY